MKALTFTVLSIIVTSLWWIVHVVCLSEQALFFFVAGAAMGTLIVFILVLGEVVKEWS